MNQIADKPTTPCESEHSSSFTGYRIPNWSDLVAMHGGAREGTYWGNRGVTPFMVRSVLDLAEEAGIASDLDLPAFKDSEAVFEVALGDLADTTLQRLGALLKQEYVATVSSCPLLAQDDSYEPWHLGTNSMHFFLLRLDTEGLWLACNGTLQVASVDVVDRGAQSRAILKAIAQQYSRWLPDGVNFEFFHANLLMSGPHLEIEFVEEFSLEAVEQALFIVRERSEDDVERALFEVMSDSFDASGCSDIAKTLCELVPEAFIENLQYGVDAHEDCVSAFRFSLLAQKWGWLLREDAKKDVDQPLLGQVTQWANGLAYMSDQDFSNIITSGGDPVVRPMSLKRFPDTTRLTACDEESDLVREWSSDLLDMLFAGMQEWSDTAMSSLPEDGTAWLFLMEFVRRMAVLDCLFFASNFDDESVCEALRTRPINPPAAQAA